MTRHALTPYKAKTLRHGSGEDIYEYTYRQISETKWATYVSGSELVGTSGSEAEAIQVGARHHAACTGGRRG